MRQIGDKCETLKAYKIPQRMTASIHSLGDSRNSCPEFQERDKRRL
jgi:hypothetical protein